MAYQDRDRCVCQQRQSGCIHGIVLHPGATFAKVDCALLYKGGVRCHECNLTVATCTEGTAGAPWATCSFQASVVRTTPRCDATRAHLSRAGCSCLLVVHAQRQELGLVLLWRAQQGQQGRQGLSSSKLQQSSSTHTGMTVKQPAMNKVRCTSVWVWPYMMMPWDLGGLGAKIIKVTTTTTPACLTQN